MWFAFLCIVCYSGASGRLCFVIVAFPKYLRYYVFCSLRCPREKCFRCFTIPTALCEAANQTAHMSQVTFFTK